MKSLSTVATVQLRYSNNVYHQAEDAEPGLGEENIMIGTQQCRWGEWPNPQEHKGRNGVRINQLMPACQIRL